MDESFKLRRCIIVEFCPSEDLLLLVMRIQIKQKYVQFSWLVLLSFRGAIFYGVIFLVI